MLVCVVVTLMCVLSLAGGNVLILNTWGEQSGPHMQALHFSFAAGAFVSPIIAKLLFGSERTVSEAETATSKPLNSTAVLPTAPPIILDSMWSYIVIGSFLLLNSFFFFALYSRSGASKDRARSASEQPLVARHHTALVVLLFFFFFAYVGAEVAYGSFIFTFAKDYAHLSQPEAAGLNSLFWGVFAATRGLAIFFAACLHPGTMIILCLVGSMVSSVLLSLFSRNSAALWVCSGLYGASMATTFPSGISWLEQYTTVTGHTAAAFVLGAGLGEMVLPALVGFLMGRFPKQPLLMYLSLITAIFTTILFPLMYRLVSAPSSQKDDGEYRQALLDSGANEEEEEQEQDEAEQWNNVEFEVIEMDKAPRVMDSPNKTPTPPGATGSSAASSSQTLEAAGPVADPTCL